MQKARKKGPLQLESAFSQIEVTPRESINPVSTLATEFMDEYRHRNPQFRAFVECALGHVTRLLGEKPAEDVSELEKVSAPAWGYPYTFIGAREPW